MEKNINENEASLEELKTDLDVRRNKLDEALSETADEKAALENSRKQITEIDDSTMQVYNKVISARSGIAVVPLSGNSCGGCGQLFHYKWYLKSEQAIFITVKVVVDLFIIRKINLLS